MRKVCTLGMSFDHRIVDGDLGAAVLRDVGAMLSDPLRMLAWSCYQCRAGSLCQLARHHRPGRYSSLLPGRPGKPGWRGLFMQMLDTFGRAPNGWLGRSVAIADGEPHCPVAEVRD